VSVGSVLRAVDGPLAGVRGMRPEETRYTGSAEYLPSLWVAVRAAVRDVVDEVSLAELRSGRMPAHVRKLTTRADAWRPR
jgi:DNA-binding IscR family transcriptional regulator